jgi:hypothetical protein
VLLLSYHLYDARGELIADSDGFAQVAEALTICCGGGEQLLHVPLEPEVPLQYRLYNPTGLLLTWSDGSRTKIYPNLRMEGVARGWSLPSVNGNGHTNGSSTK